MPIEWREATRQWHLHNASISYVMQAHGSGRLVHLHFGPRLAQGKDYGHLFRHPFISKGNQVLDPVAMELPTPGRAP